MIIKVLIALVLFMIIYMAFRLFFGAETTPVATSSSLDTVQLEKTLQKILEAQGKSPVMATPVAGAAPAGGEILKAAGASSSGTVAELEALKKELAEKEILLGQARQEAAKAVAVANAVAAPAAAAENSGKSNEAVSKLELKIKDLEARLAEYEIISEDIADLSFYKEENARLQNELTTRQGGGESGGSGGGGGTGSVERNAVPEAPSSAPAPTPVAESVVPASSATSAASADLGSVQTEAANSVSVAASGEPEGPVGISPAEDDLMKEFAKAVEEQKGPTGEPSTQVTVGDAAENSQLMNQFENFVKKS